MTPLELQIILGLADSRLLQIIDDLESFGPLSEVEEYTLALAKNRLKEIAPGDSNG